MDFRAVIFIPALAAAALCVYLFLTFAAHYYLTILESTAAGAKEVTWISETIIDNFWKPLYLGWLLCLWLGPAYVLGRILAASSGFGWLQLAVPGMAVWLLYPVSQLSSLSAASVWIPLHVQVFTRLAQKPMAAIGFLILTLPVIALVGLAFKWAFLTKDAWHLLFASVPLLVFSAFFYARLLGRLAFALMYTRDLLKRKKRKGRKPRELHVRVETPGVSMLQPSDLPPLASPEGELTGYNVLITDDAPPRKKRVVAEAVNDEPTAMEMNPANSRRVVDGEDEDARPYEVSEAQHVPEQKSDQRSITVPDANEMALLDRTAVRKPSRSIWNWELLSFLTQHGTISAYMVLSGTGLLAGVMIRLARFFDPTGGAE